mmetsp:Transcript_15154/g.48471  ORF Transcript_15154/g.48471 Transcript_15154/m.48471 type:complete len:123 (+) Transcript_15154:73-441(+)
MHRPPCHGVAPLNHGKKCKPDEKTKALYTKKLVNKRSTILTWRRSTQTKTNKQRSMRSKKSANNFEWPPFWRSCPQTNMLKPSAQKLQTSALGLFQGGRLAGKDLDSNMCLNWVLVDPNGPS